MVRGERRGREPPLTFERIAGGRSNLTYGVTDARAPLGSAPPAARQALGSAHDMGRETRSSPPSPRRRVPVPPIAGLCEDESVNGAPFYVMDFVDGPDPAQAPRRRAAFDEAQRRAIG